MAVFSIPEVEGAVYVLCAATALACAVLLLRGYRRSRTRLLLWCGLCFLALTAENVVLFFDLVVYQDVDLMALRRACALVGVSVLLYGLVWEVR
ncbi:MAG TPA: DUF5985 family protein [Fimbriiglobus sp.]|nr:DUF5985 family protein [Fimbriiglobus sp.]